MPILSQLHQEVPHLKIFHRCNGNSSAEGESDREEQSPDSHLHEKNVTCMVISADFSSAPSRQRYGKLHPSESPWQRNVWGIKMATAVALSPANAHGSPLRQWSQSRPTGLRRVKPKGTSLLCLRSRSHGSRINFSRQKLIFIWVTRTRAALWKCLPQIMTLECCFIICLATLDSS